MITAHLLSFILQSTPETGLPETSWSGGSFIRPMPKKPKPEVRKPGPVPTVNGTVVNGRFIPAKPKDSSEIETRNRRTMTRIDKARSLLKASMARDAARLLETDINDNPFLAPLTADALSDIYFASNQPLKAYKLLEPLVPGCPNYQTLLRASLAYCYGGRVDKGQRAFVNSWVNFGPDYLTKDCKAQSDSPKAVAFSSVLALVNSSTGFPEHDYYVELAWRINPHDGCACRLYAMQLNGMGKYSSAKQVAEDGLNGDITSGMRLELNRQIAFAGKKLDRADVPNIRVSDGHP